MQGIREQQAPSDALAQVRRRLVVATPLLLAALVVLAARLVQLQYYDRAHFADLADRQHSVTEFLPARPGEILDRSGRVLATSVLVQSLYADPRALADPRKVARQLARPLGLDAQALYEKFASAGARRFVWIKRRLTEQETKAVAALKLDPAAVGFREEFRRYYPQGRLAAHVLGFRTIDGQGEGGVEESFDERLRGRDGQRHHLRDAAGKLLEVFDAADKPARLGQEVILTLDAYVQTFVEEALDALIAEWKPAGACAIVIDPRTGDVLAMGTRPSFDPNDMNGVSADAWRNRAINDVYEPGSTFKPFVMARALDAGAVRREETIHGENGLYRMGRRLLHDHHPFGSLSLADVIIRSSNIGMAKVGQRLGNQGMYQAAVDFGFGQPTHIPLPGESPGMLLPLRQWTSYSTGSVPMGQEIGVTPLQLITAYAALANGGKLLKPKLVLGAVDRPSWSAANRSEAGSEATLASLRSTDHNSESAESVAEVAGASAVSRPVQPETAQWLLDPVLKGVVDSPKGTGKRARLEEFDVFGKSGTAQKAGPKGAGYSHRHHVSSFIAGGPLPEPRALVLVMVDEPTGGGQHYGGTVAAPTAANILRRTLIHLQAPGKVKEE